jgi:hypothetical protein
VTCKLCSKSGLVWKTINDKWRLTDKSGVHICEEYIKARESSETNTPSTLEEAIIVIRRLERTNAMLLAEIEEMGEPE